MTVPSVLVVEVIRSSLESLNVVSDMGAPKSELVGVDLTGPQTPAATAALAVATRYYTPALLHHCLRSSCGQ